MNYHLTGWVIDDIDQNGDAVFNDFDELFDGDAHAACTHECSRGEVMIEQVPS